MKIKQHTTTDKSVVVFNTYSIEQDLGRSSFYHLTNDDFAMLPVNRRKEGVWARLHKSVRSA